MQFRRKQPFISSYKVKPGFIIAKANLMGKSDAIFSSFELQTIEEVENEKDTAGKDVGSGLVQKLRKWCLLTELCFLCDN